MFINIKNYITENTGILIRLDDIAENMNWDLMEQSERLFDKYKIKPVLGVIPNNQDKDLLTFPKNDNFWERVRKWKNNGWEISMHGSNHVYDRDTKKKDYFSHGGKSEFFGHTLEDQISKIEFGLRKFEKENIQIRSFFAPNHTYDDNTFIALKSSGINEVIDGYGLMPYTENSIKFIPQLLYKNVSLPFGIQSTQIHLNEWTQKDFNNFEKFIIKNLDKIICYNQAIEKLNNNFLYKLLNIFTKRILLLKRTLKK